MHDVDFAKDKAKHYSNPTDLLIGTAKSLPHKVPGHRKAVMFAGRVKAVVKRACKAVLEIGVTCLT
eukprot:1160553-Pelagomonas_calceolata.AAC.7